MSLIEGCPLFWSFHCMSILYALLHASFLIDETMAPPGVNLSRVFHVQPPSSALYPTDKPQTVAVTFRSDTEFEIKNCPVLKCQV